MNISQHDQETLVQILTTDTANIHFLWNYDDRSLIQFGKKLFPEDVMEPLDHMREMSWVEETSQAVFDVFRSQIEDGILNGTDSNGLTIELPIRYTKDEAFVYHRIHAQFLRDAHKKIRSVLVTLRPFSNKEVFEKNVLGFFTSDKNPSYFTRRVKEMMTKYADRQIAFVQFDVERFKLINDNYGVETGDALLKFFSDSLSLICSDDQPFCRLSSDLFMIVIVFDQESEILDFIHMLESRLSGYMGLDYRMAFGVAIAADRSLHTRRHGDNATLARQSVKGNALNNIGFYNGTLRTELYKQQTIEGDMTDALLNNEFVMYLQPKHSISTGRIIGAEALARWIHPRKGMISPADFVPVFEKNGFIVKLDQYMWECACKKLRKWMDTGIETVPISVNISREYLDSFDVVGKLTELIEHYSIPISLLELEITESVDSAITAQTVKRLRNSGFTMLMDDFGSGYSSLNMLKTTPFDVLKIDRDFLSEFMESDRGRKIIAHTISMSRDIGLDIIAEGVETMEQAHFLQECGCDSAQGFFYSKPIPADEFDKRLLEINFQGGR